MPIYLKLTNIFLIKQHNNTYNFANPFIKKDDQIFREKFYNLVDNNPRNSINYLLSIFKNF